MASFLQSAGRYFLYDRTRRSTQTTAIDVSATPITAAPHPMISAVNAVPSCARSVATVASLICLPSMNQYKGEPERAQAPPSTYVN